MAPSPRATQDQSPFALPPIVLQLQPSVLAAAGVDVGMGWLALATGSASVKLALGAAETVAATLGAAGALPLPAGSNGIAPAGPVASSAVSDSTR